MEEVGWVGLGFFQVRYTPFPLAGQVLCYDKQL